MGTLNLRSAADHPDLMAAPVADALKQMPYAETIGVSSIDPQFSDTAAFCEQYQVGMHESANCVVLEARRGDRSWLAACVILGSTRADINGVARKALDAKKVSFAKMDDAMSATGMEYGAITPIGLPREWPIFIDAAVAQSPRVIIGSGIRASKLALPGALLASLPNAHIIEGLAHPRTA